MLDDNQRVTNLPSSRTHVPHQPKIVDNMTQVEKEPPPIKYFEERGRKDRIFDSFTSPNPLSLAYNLLILLILLLNLFMLFWLSAYLGEPTSFALPLSPLCLPF